MDLCISAAWNGLNDDTRSLAARIAFDSRFGKALSGRRVTDGAESATSSRGHFASRHPLPRLAKAPDVCDYLRHSPIVLCRDLCIDIETIKCAR